MGFFSKFLGFSDFDDESSSSESVYFSTPRKEESEQDDVESEYTTESGENEDDEASNESDSYEKFDYSIKFKEELSTGALLFYIVDDDYDFCGGNVVVSPDGVPTVISNGYIEISSSECEYFKNQATLFYNATRTSEESNFYYNPRDFMFHFDYGIKFKKELSNGAFVFFIIDSDNDPAGGHVVVSPTGIPTIIQDCFYEIDDNSLTYLKVLAKIFYDASRAADNNLTSSNLK